MKVFNFFLVYLFVLVSLFKSYKSLVGYSSKLIYVVDGYFILQEIEYLNKFFI